MYYLLLVIGIRAAGAPLTDMVISAIPVVVAVVEQHPRTRRNMAVAGATATLVTAGIALVSVTLSRDSRSHAYLAAPTAEKADRADGRLRRGRHVDLVRPQANARFLARQCHLARGLVTAVGVATGAVALAGLPAAALIKPAHHAVRHAHRVRPGGRRGVFLGVVVSWAGTPLPDLASGRLSPAMAGLLVNLETVSGFSYVYAARQHWPGAEPSARLALVLAWRR